MKIELIARAALGAGLICLFSTGVAAQEAGAGEGAAAKSVPDTGLTTEIKELEGLRAEVQKAKAGEEKQRRTSEFLGRVKELADGYVAGMKYEEAGKVLQTAQAIAGQGKTGQAEEIIKLTKEVQKKKGAAAKVNQLVAKFDKAKPDAKAARQIVDLYVFELELPEKAAEYAEATGDKALTARVTLAATPTEKLDAMQLVDLGDYYSQGAKNNPMLKSQLYEAAKETYEKALAKGIKDEKVKKRVEALTMSEKDKAALPTTPVGELNRQVAAFYQSFKNLSPEGPFTAEQKKTVDPMAKQQFVSGRETTAGGVISTVTPTDIPGVKDKVKLTISITMEEITDRKVSVSVVTTVAKADEKVFTPNGQILVAGRVTSAVMNNATNVIKMDGTVKQYRPDPNAAAAAEEAAKAGAKKK